MFTDVQLPVRQGWGWGPGEARIPPAAPTLLTLPYTLLYIFTVHELCSRTVGEYSLCATEIWMTTLKKINWCKNVFWALGMEWDVVPTLHTVQLYSVNCNLYSFFHIFHLLHWDLKSKIVFPKRARQKEKYSNNPNPTSIFYQSHAPTSMSNHFRVRRALYALQTISTSVHSLQHLVISHLIFAGLFSVFFAILLLRFAFFYNFLCF
jgi:hypothetical protein